MQGQTRYEEDEIDLKELILTLWKNKKFIIFFTLIVTILAIVYVLVKTPIYEARALVELGYYLDKDYEKINLYENNIISEKLNVFFIAMKKNIKDRDSWVDKISSSKKEKSFLEISSLGKSNKIATDEIKKVLNFLNQKDKKQIVSIQERNKLLLKDIDKQMIDEEEIFLKTLKSSIEYMQKVAIPSFNKKIKNANNKINKIESQLKEANAQIKTNQNKTSAEATIAIKNSLELDLAKEKANLLEIETLKQQLESEELPSLELNKKNPIATNKVLNDLQKEKRKLEIQILEENFKNSSIVGEIITNDHPIKPKRKLVVIVAFITSFVMSIFLVFFVEFIKNLRNEEKAKSSN